VHSGVFVLMRMLFRLLIDKEGQEGSGYQLLWRVGLAVRLMELNGRRERVRTLRGQS
jgi:hypothetical protein